MVFRIELQDWFPLLKTITWAGSQLIQPCVITCNLKRLSSDQYKTRRNRILQLMAYIFSFQVYTYNGQNADKSFIQENLFTRFIYHKIQSFLVCLSCESTIQDQMKVYYILGFFLENYMKRWIQLTGNDQDNHGNPGDAIQRRSVGYKRKKKKHKQQVRVEQRTYECFFCNTLDADSTFLYHNLNYVN